MFAIIALVIFVLVAFKVDPFDAVDLLPLGLAFLALHLVVGMWPFNRS